MYTIFSYHSPTMPSIDCHCFYRMFLCLFTGGTPSSLPQVSIPGCCVRNQDISLLLRSNGAQSVELPLYVCRLLVWVKVVDQIKPHLSRLVAASRGRGETEFQWRAESGSWQRKREQENRAKSELHFLLWLYCEVMPSHSSYLDMWDRIQSTQEENGNQDFNFVCHIYLVGSASARAQ